jgi:hypothetical protein
MEVSLELAKYIIKYHIKYNYRQLNVCPCGQIHLTTLFTCQICKVNACNSICYDKYFDSHYICNSCKEQGATDAAITPELLQFIANNYMKSLVNEKIDLSCACGKIHIAPQTQSKCRFCNKVGYDLACLNAHFVCKSPNLFCPLYEDLCKECFVIGSLIKPSQYGDEAV